MKSLQLRIRTKFLRHNILPSLVFDVVVIRALLIGCKFHANARRRSMAGKNVSSETCCRIVGPVRLHQVKRAMLMDHSDARGRLLVSQKFWLISDQVGKLIKTIHSKKIFLFTSIFKKNFGKFIWFLRRAERFRL